MLRTGKRKAEKDKRRKMVRTKYGQTPLRHSLKGIQSCVYAGLSFLLLVIVVVISFLSKGKVGILFGFAGLGLLALSCKAFFTGLAGLKERGKNYITCKVGIAVSSMMILGMCAIFIGGLF